MNKEQLFAMVKEIKETTSIEEVNKLIQEGWIVLVVAPTNPPKFAIGRT